jgi:hypothetical protein
MSNKVVHVDFKHRLLLKAATELARQIDPKKVASRFDLFTFDSIVEDVAKDAAVAAQRSEQEALRSILDRADKLDW